MKKYKAEYGWRFGVKEFDIERETNASVWIDGKRLSKRTAFVSYFDTWQGAHDRVVEIATIRVEGARNRLARAEADLQAALAIKQPD